MFYPETVLFCHCRMSTEVYYIIFFSLSALLLHQNSLFVPFFIQRDHRMTEKEEEKEFMHLKKLL